MTKIATNITGAPSCSQNDQGFVFSSIKNGGKTISKCSELSKSECRGSGINTAGYINQCDLGVWFWEDDCVNGDTCKIEIPTVIDPTTKNRKLKSSRNFTDKDYSELCSFAASSETNYNIKSMRQREPVMGRPKNPDMFDTATYPVWSNGENMCSAAGLEKLDTKKTLGIEELNLSCNKRDKNSCEQSEGDSSLYPTKNGSLCRWIDKTNDYSSRGCWPNTNLCQGLTSKQRCENHPSHLCWWDSSVFGNNGMKGLCTKYNLLEDTYLNTTNNVPRSDYWFETDDGWKSSINWKQGQSRRIEDGRMWAPCVPTKKLVKAGEVFSDKFECESYWNGRSICDRETLSCSKETINYSSKDETYSSQELCSKNCKPEFGCFANKDGVKVCRQVGKGDTKPSKTYDSLEECQKGTNYCNDLRWGCYSGVGENPSCIKLARGSPGYLSKEECQKKTNYCGKPRFACLNEGNGRECTELPQGAVFDPSYISLKACQTESNYCGSGPPRKWGCLNTGSGKECSLYPEGADSPYNTKEECESGTNFCNN